MAGIDSQLLRFCLAGAFGFIIDTGVLYLAVRVYGLGPYVGRVISYLAAATTTWKLNRRYTFIPKAGRPWHHEWLGYVSANAIGGGMNYLTYVLCLHYVPIAREHLVLGVAAGSTVGLVFNFTASKWWVFAHHRG